MFHQTGAIFQCHSYSLHEKAVSSKVLIASLIRGYTQVMARVTGKENATPQEIPQLVMLVMRADSSEMNSLRIMCKR